MDVPVELDEFGSNREEGPYIPDPPDDIVQCHEGFEIFLLVKVTAAGMDRVLMPILVVFQDTH
jgi:hypothetical protein